MFGFGIFMGVVFPFYAALFDSWQNPLFKLGSFFAGLMIGLFCFVMVQVIVLREIKKINDFAQSLKNNDLTTKISIDSNDQIGRIVSNLSHSTQSIRSLISQIFSTSELLVGSLNDLRSFAANMDHSASEISSRSHAMTSTADMISRNSSGITASTSETAQSVVKVTEDVAKLTKSLELMNHQCLHKVELTSEVSREFMVTRDSIVELATHSNEISNIADIISSIADQTNLLAINAAVEAANAGTHGKSFAIVAAEVKSLANQSLKSAAGISQLIDKISPIIDKSRDAITGSTSKMQNLTLLSQEIAEATTEDLSLLKLIDKELTQASKNMKDVSDRVRQNNEGICESTEKLNLVNSAIEAISHDIHEGTDSIHMLEREAAKLAEMTRRFKV